MDIGSGKEYPACALSNFSPHPFVFRGFQVSSMEGFLQGLKFASPDKQEYVFKLVGRAAKFAGQHKKWWRDQRLYFQGEPINRCSADYDKLLVEVYTEMTKQSDSFRRALLASQNATFRHSIGKSDIHKTVLTEREFCNLLSIMRHKLQNNQL
jgi:predicted NAD-dependent protein-ADP-ribosyltransferase YbiA (DUF1768 family)